MAGWPTGWPAFLWGAATSSHQIEGGQDNDWTQWEEQGRAADRSGLATNHWELWRNDYALLGEIGLNSYRLSLEWSRIEPTLGTFNLEVLQQYRAMITHFRELGIVPLLTLHHFTLPRWVADRGGLLHPDAARWFARYVKRVMTHLGDLVDLYVTINEPMVFVVMGYLIGLWPPGTHGFARALRLIKRLVTVHRAAYQTIKEARPDAWVGLAHHLIAFEPLRPNSWADHMTSRVLHYLMNDRFIRLVGNAQDFIGINYYTRQYAHWSRGLHPIPSRPGQPLTDLGWEIYPQGLIDVLQKIHTWDKPILVTENGIATNEDPVREHYLEDHLQMISHAQRLGLDIRGYFHWSLLDNFEWAEGYAPRFGLVGIDYQTLTRTIRPSAKRYAEIIRANQQHFPITVSSTSATPVYYS